MRRRVSMLGSGVLMALVVTFAMGAGANGLIAQDDGATAAAPHEIERESVRVTVDEDAEKAYEEAERARLSEDSEHVAQVSTAPTPEPEPQPEQSSDEQAASPAAGGTASSGARGASASAAPASGGTAQTAAAPAQQAAPAAPACPSSIGGGAGGAPGGSTGSGIGRTTNDDLAGFAAAYNAIRVANCLEPVPYGNFRYSSCMEDRLVWMAEDPDPNPVNTWGHAGTISNGYSQSVPDRGCDGNLAGGSGNTGATMAQKWWDSSAHRASLYKPGSSVAGVCITFAMIHGGLPNDGYGFTRASARWGGC